MRKSKFTVEQIAFALRQVEGGTAGEQVCRRMSVSWAILYRGNIDLSGMGVAELGRRSQLEEEIRKLKHLVADLSLDRKVLQDFLSEKVRPRPADPSWRSFCEPPAIREPLRRTPSASLAAAGGLGG